MNGRFGNDNALAEITQTINCDKNFHFHLSFLDFLSSSRILVIKTYNMMNPEKIHSNKYRG